jgi:hypothetical protein
MKSWIILSVLSIMASVYAVPVKLLSLVTALF